MNGISTEHDGGAAAPAASERRSQLSPSQRSTPSYAQQLTDEQLVATISAPEPRMAALAISNDALRDSLRPWVPPSVGGWLHKTLVEPWWRYVEYGYTEAVCWLWARAPWQRWALSAGLGALLGVGLVIIAARRFRPELESVAVASSETVLASTQLGAASSMIIAPLRASAGAPQAAEAPPAAEAVKAEPALAADGLAVPEPDAPSVIEISDQAVDDSATQEPSKSKKGRHGHGRKRAAKPKASQLSELFRSMHRTPRERGIQ